MGVSVFLFFRCNKIRWRFVWDFFFQREKNALQPCSSVWLRIHVFCFDVVFVWYRFVFFVTFQVQEVCFWWFLVDWKVNHFIPQGFVQNHVNLRLLWMFLMPDLLISSFFPNDLKKATSLHLRLGETTIKTVTRIKVPLEAYTVEVGIAQKKSDWWCEH